MADSIASAGEEDAVSEGFKEWERINCAPFIRHSPTTGWPLVSIRDVSSDQSPDDLILFPPVNHENLHASTNPQYHIQSSFSSPFPPSPWESSSPSTIGTDNDDGSYSLPPSEFQLSEPEKSLPDSPKRPPYSTFGSASWWNFGIKVLLSKFYGSEQHFRNISCTAPGTVASFLSLFGRSTLAAVAVIFLYFRWRRRLTRSGQSRGELIRTIAQKDERINQLMNQIAEMNQLLLALHRGHHVSNT
ncbi:unnamed protein product [Cuscuta epithymum]|uniref:Uncharacterized protein n=1 Tax=Cuscuta epithymum TaxID=186058 RepID=A0AAV0EAT5_9ASTE|nr:unnamed protein product [Cuscuta epithymum]